MPRTKQTMHGRDETTTKRARVQPMHEALAEAVAEKHDDVVEDLLFMGVSDDDVTRVIQETTAATPEHTLALLVRNRALDDSALVHLYRVRDRIGAELALAVLMNVETAAAAVSPDAHRFVLGCVDVYSETLKDLRLRHAHALVATM